MVKPEDDCPQACCGGLSIPILQKYLCIGDYHFILLTSDKVFRTSTMFQIIRRQESENYSWILFLNPMNRYLWMMLGLHSLFLVVIVWSFWWCYNRKMSSTSGQKEKMPSIQEQAQHYLAVCSSYLGGSSGAMPHDDKSALKEVKPRGFQAVIYILTWKVGKSCASSNFQSVKVNYTCDPTVATSKIA